MAEEEEKVELRPANKNFWYALATIAGEPDVYGGLFRPDTVVEKNRYYWNGYMKTGLSPEKLDALVDLTGKRIILPDLTDDDWNTVEEILKERGMGGVSDLQKFRGADFSHLTFPKRANFSGFFFDGSVTFTGSQFHGNAVFDNTYFLGGAFFDNVIFMGIASFKCAQVQLNATFVGAQFSGQANFSGALFACEVDYSSAQFSGKLNFFMANFRYTPPQFYDAKISENIVWYKAQFTDLPKKANFNWDGKYLQKHLQNRYLINFISPEHLQTKFENDNITLKSLQNEIVVNNISSYERLSLMMSKLEKHHDRHMFWRHEMRARRQLETNWFSRYMNALYECLSDYGYGFGRALAWWFGHTILGGLLIFAFTNHSWANVVNSFATSFSNAHSFLGLNRGPLKKVYEGYVAEGSGIEDWFNALWTVQGLFGIMFLFFLILTIRNRFKMG